MCFTWSDPKLMPLAGAESGAHKPFQNPLQIRRVRRFSLELQYASYPARPQSVQNGACHLPILSQRTRS